MAYDNQQYWWEDQPQERFWCEITAREFDEIGTNLSSYKVDARGRAYLSSKLIRQVRKKDIVFHYFIPSQSFVGSSVAKGSAEKRGKSYIVELGKFSGLQVPFTLSDVRDDARWIKGWIRDKQKSCGVLGIPFSNYGPSIRTAEAYLTKMPLEFVERWRPFTRAMHRLSGNRLPQGPARIPARLLSPRHYKSEDPYTAIIQGHREVRSRNHERLVNRTRRIFERRGATIYPQHPLDLLMLHPLKIIFEGKLAGKRHPVFAVRDALGQLLTYRFFNGPPDAEVCILLDSDPGEGLQRFAERVHVDIVWLNGNRLRARNSTAKRLRQAGLF
jgi:hypothetical protein